ncbi:MAG: glycosyltransferase [Acidiphilium sp.]|nr:glycosyltransferase [Acidiphilium sp.]MDD4936671.1 glycosyltransferase [Acidiphilium sp.]
MIFVTVGTTMPFDELLVEVDRLAGEGFLSQELICQGGQSKYRMIHGEQFIGRPSIADLIDQASLVISHGGATVIQLLIARKPFIAFPNPRGAGDHQTSFLRKIAQVSDISWSSDIADLCSLINDRIAKGPAKIRSDFPRASGIIMSMTDSSRSFS